MLGSSWCQYGWGGNVGFPRAQLCADWLSSTWGRSQSPAHVHVCKCKAFPDAAYLPLGPLKKCPLAASCCLVILLPPLGKEGEKLTTKAVQISLERLAKLWLTILHDDGLFSMSAIIFPTS